VEPNEEYAIVLTDWPLPAVVAEAQVCANESSVSIRYRGEDERTVIIRFSLCHYVIFGEPNDEALGGHPLAKKGLQYYSVHEVLNSSLISKLERRNSIHPRHDRDSYLRDMKHYVFTFQDSTLEFVVSGEEMWKPTVGLFNSGLEADHEWRKLD
jgi:hypothetical protein